MINPIQVRVPIDTVLDKHCCRVSDQYFSTTLRTR